MTPLPRLRAATVARDLVGFTVAVCDGFEEVGLTLSDTKNQCAASECALGNMVADGLAKYGVKLLRRVKSLGVQWALVSDDAPPPPGSGSMRSLRAHAASGLSRGRASTSPVSFVRAAFLP